MAAIILRIIYWASWALVLMDQGFAMVYLVRPGDEEFARTHHSSLAEVACLIAISLVTCGGIRWWISRIRHPGWRLIPYWIGLLCAMFTWMFGIYLVLDWRLFFQILGSIWTLIYIPAFLTERKPEPVRPPPIPQ